MKKVNSKRFLFLVIAGISILLFNPSNSFSAREYFNDSVFGGLDVIPDDNECLPAVSRCISQVCKEEDPVKAKMNGIYSGCDAYQRSKIYNYIEGCLNSISYQDKIKYIPYCSKFVVKKVDEFLGNKDILNDSLAEGSMDCQSAKVQENVSASCFNFVVGQQPPLQSEVLLQLYSLCGDGVFGGSNRMAEEYFFAGSYSASEAAARGLGVNAKRDNWKDAVKAVAISYQSIRQKACGYKDDLYKMPMLK